MLSAETIRIGALLNFAAGEACRDNSRARLHFDLMNHRADGRNEDLVDFAESHRALCQSDPFHSAHFLIGVEQNFNLALDRNAERVFDEGVLPGIDVRLFRSKCDVGLLGERRSFSDGDGLRSASIHAFLCEPVGGSETPRARGDYTDPDTERLRLNEGANFAVFRRDVPLADVHHTRIGVGGTTALGGIDGSDGPILHYKRPPMRKSAMRQTNDTSLSLPTCQMGNTRRDASRKQKSGKNLRLEIFSCLFLQ